jgi:hypothetical protein
MQQMILTAEPEGSLNGNSQVSVAAYIFNWGILGIATRAAHAYLPVNQLLLAASSSGG